MLADSYHLVLEEETSREQCLRCKGCGSYGMRCVKLATDYSAIHASAVVVVLNLLSRSMHFVHVISIITIS